MPKAKVDTNKKLPEAIIEQMLTLATSGFGLVAALAWNNVIQATVNDYIKPYISKDSGIISLLIYAVLITVLAVFTTYQLTKLQQALLARRSPRPQR